MTATRNGHTLRPGEPLGIQVMDVEPRLRPSTTSKHQHRVPHGQMLPRARRLIDAICALCDQWIEPTLRLCLDRFDKQMYEQAEKSRSHLEQQCFFDSRHMAQQGRTVFIQSFVACLRDSFEHMGVEDGDDAPTPLDRLSLTLLDRTEHELTAAIDKLAARSESHNGPLLSELSYRLAVLVASPPLEGKELPPGPQNLAHILRIASEPLNLPIEHRLMLLQVFESSVGGALVSLYESINAKLLADGILPQLRAFVVTRATHGPSHGGGASSSANPATAAPSVVQTAERSEPITVLDNLREQLARQRTAATGSAPSANERTASPEELQTALSALQEHMVQVTDRTSRELRSAQRLHEELLQQINVGLPPGASRTQLTADQGDTVDLVAMLFEQLAQQLHHGPDARALLGNLQLPLLRLAIADGDFFNHREHPARQMLGRIAETIDNWLEGPNGDVDHQVLAKLSQLVERAQGEPPTAGLYTSLLADIEYHLAQLSRKAQATERRHVEAMQGHEKLEQARRRADTLMAERLAATSPRGLLRTLLERAWTDVLALNLLRHGEHSDAFLHQLRITDQMLGQLPMTDPSLLRGEIETGLQQIGMHVDEAEQVAKRLIGAEAPAPAESKGEDTPTPVAPPQPAPPIATKPPPHTADVPSATDLAIRLKKRQRLGEQRQETPPTPTPTNIEIAPPLGLREARIHNHLRQLPFGTWFEFTDTATGKSTPYKLAWFSPLSGNSLFVNRRGQRSDVMNLQELARAIADGRVREMTTHEDNLFDRAWHALTNTLQRPAPSMPEARS